MKKTINFVLSVDSVESAIGKLKVERKGLQQKNEEFVRRVAEVGLEKAQSVYFGDGQGGDPDEPNSSFSDIEVTSSKKGATSKFTLSGEDALFVEFGAGIYYNTPVGTSPNPLGEDLGYTIGSYGKGKGSRKAWGYRDEQGNLHITHGTQARMPMYYAGEEMKEKMMDIAHEVYGV